jgi:DNA-binding LacI/PurR family transcriptional regulator
MKSDRVPLSTRISEKLRHYIFSEAAAGDRIATETELARKYDVSVATIREAVLILIKEGLLDRRQGSGTYVKTLRRPSHVAILCEMDLTHPRCSRYFIRLVFGLKAALEGQGITATVYLGQTAPGAPSSEFSNRDFLAALSAGRVGAVVAVQALPGPWLGFAEAQGVSVLGCSPIFSRSITWGLEDALANEVERLIAAGRRRFALLNWCDRSHPIKSSRKDAVAGMLAALLKAHRLSLPSHRVVDDLHPSLAGAGYDGVREIWSAQDEKPDALIIANDALVGDALLAVQELFCTCHADLDLVVESSAGETIFAPFPMTIIEQDPSILAAELARESVALLASPLASPRKVQIAPARYQVKAGTRLLTEVLP